MKTVPFSSLPIGAVFAAEDAEWRKMTTRTAEPVKAGKYVGRYYFAANARCLPLIGA